MNENDEMEALGRLLIYIAKSDTARLAGENVSTWDGYPRVSGPTDEIGAQPGGDRTGAHAVRRAEDTARWKLFMRGVRVLHGLARWLVRLADTTDAGCRSCIRVEESSPVFARGLCRWCYHHTPSGQEMPSWNDVLAHKQGRPVPKPRRK